MEDDIKRLYDRLNQVMGYLLAHSAMVRTLAGMIALDSPDWRGVLDNFRIMCEFNIKSLEWGGSLSEGEEIRKEALDHLTTGLNDLHAALLQSEIDRSASDDSSDTGSS